jgi:hypothetical protein
MFVVNPEFLSSLQDRNLLNNISSTYNYCYMFSPVLFKAAEEPLVDNSPRINFRKGPGG